MIVVDDRQVVVFAATPHQLIHYFCLRHVVQDDYVIVHTELLQLLHLQFAEAHSHFVYSAFVRVHHYIINHWAELLRNILSLDHSGVITHQHLV